MSDERKYVAVSIKHSEYKWKFGDSLVLWGWHQTEDNEERCFSAYTTFLSKAERYAVGDFRKHGYGSEIYDENPVKICVDFCKKYRKFDTVLVDAEKYRQYCELCEIPQSPGDETLGW